MSQNNHGIRILVAMVIVIAAVMFVVFNWEPSVEQTETQPSVEESENPDNPIDGMVQNLQQMNRDMKEVNRIVAERNEAARQAHLKEDDLLKQEVSYLLANRDELAARVGYLEETLCAQDERWCASADEPGMSEERVPAKVAALDDGTSFFAPSCGVGANGTVVRFISKDETRTGYNRPCIPLAGRKFSLGVGDGPEAVGTMTKPVSKPIPNAIAPYRPRRELLDARRTP